MIIIVIHSVNIAAYSGCATLYTFYSLGPYFRYPIISWNISDFAIVLLYFDNLRRLALTTCTRMSKSSFGGAARRLITRRTSSELNIIYGLPGARSRRLSLRTNEARSRIANTNYEYRSHVY